MGSLIRPKSKACSTRLTEEHLGLPAGITVEGATPRGEGRWCELTGAPTPPPRWRTSVQKRGVAPSTITPYRAARRRAGRGGDTRGGAPLRFTAEDSRNPCQPMSNADFQVKPTPQRGGLRPLRVARCGVKRVHHLRAHRYVVAVSPIRRHRRDPQLLHSFLWT